MLLSSASTSKAQSADEVHEVLRQQLWDVPLHDMTSIWKDELLGVRDQAHSTIVLACV